MRTSPFHSRTSALCHSFAWKEWAGQAAVCSYDRHSEREYFAFRGTAGLIDVSPLFKYEVEGPDAAAFLSRVWTRDVTGLRPSQVVYATMCDGAGKLLDDGTISCLLFKLIRDRPTVPPKRSTHSLWLWPWSCLKTKT